MQIGKQSGMFCVAALLGISLMSDAAAQKQKQRTEHHRLAKPNGLHAAKPYGAGLNEEDSLRALESEISRKLGSNIQESDYPEEARHQGWSGTALIAVLVASNGKIKDVSPRTLKHVRTQMSLHVLAYNMKRVMRILGIGEMLKVLAT